MQLSKSTPGSVPEPAHETLRLGGHVLVYKKVGAAAVVAITDDAVVVNDFVVMLLFADIAAVVDLAAVAETVINTAVVGDAFIIDAVIVDSTVVCIVVVAVVGDTVIVHSVVVVRDNDADDFDVVEVVDVVVNGCVLDVVDYDVSIVVVIVVVDDDDDDDDDFSMSTGRML